MNYQGGMMEVEGESLSHLSKDMIYEAASEGSSMDTNIDDRDNFSKFIRKETSERGRSLRLFIYGILEATVIQGIKKLQLEDAIELTDNVKEADVLLALHSKIKKNPRVQAAARSHDVPVYLTKGGSLIQVMKAISSLMSEREDNLKVFELDDGSNEAEKADALEEARLAVEQIAIPKGEPVELLPRAAHIISLQMELVKKYELESEIIGSKQETKRLLILPLNAKASRRNDVSGGEFGDNGAEDFAGKNGNTNGTAYSVERLPLLPD